MANKPIQIRPKGTGDYADVLHPETSVGQVVGLQTELNKIPTLKSEVASHTEDAAIHFQTGERDKWNAKATHDDIRVAVEQTAFSTKKLSIDSNGIFTTIELRRKSDGTLAEKSVLSGGASPKYTTRTVTYYGKDGLPTGKVDVFTLTYNADGVLIEEV